MSSYETRWWTEKEPAASLAAIINELEQETQGRRSRIIHYLRLYGTRESIGLSSNEVDILPDLWQDVGLRYNVIKSVIDTAVSRIGKNKPKATFLTSGGNWSLQRQAQRLEKYVEGSFYETDLYRKGRSVFRDACILGTGVLKFYERQTSKGWKVWCERVFPWELMVSKHDGRYCEPRSIYHIKWMDQRVVKEMFKGKVTDEDIETASRATTELYEIDAFDIVEQVQVIEAWHLPSGPGAKDGKHVISISTKTLLQEPWEEEWFPFSFYHWSRPIVGFWGTGITKDINGIQIEINRLLDKLQQAYQLFANPWVAVHRSSRITKTHITNQIGRILEYEGATPPQIVTHNPITPQIFPHLTQLKQDAFDIPGVSQTSAQNRKPADLESGEALRTWNDIEDTRHADPALEYEQFYMDAAKVIIGMSRRMHGRDKTPIVMATHRRRSRRWIEVIKWSEVNLDESSYAMQVYPSSSLPSTPAGKTATVQEWMRAGLIGPDEARYLLDFPDLEEHSSLKLAPIDVVLDAIEEMVDNGNYVGPEPFQNLPQTLELVQAAYLRAKLDKVPEERLELLRRYITATNRLLDIAMGKMPATLGGMGAEAQQQAPAAPAQPTGVPSNGAGAGLPEPGVLSALPEAGIQ